MKNIPLMPVPDGYKVRVIHVHDPDTLKTWHDTKCALGARSPKRKTPRYVTYAYVVDAAHNAIIYGTHAFSVCSHLDNPSRRKGRAVAHNRAVSQLIDLMNERHKASST